MEGQLSSSLQLRAVAWAAEDIDFPMVVVVQELCWLCVLRVFSM